MKLIASFFLILFIGSIHVSGDATNSPEDLKAIESYKRFSSLFEKQKTIRNYEGITYQFFFKGDSVRVLVSADQATRKSDGTFDFNNCLIGLFGRAATASETSLFNSELDSALSGVSAITEVKIVEEDSLGPGLRIDGYNSSRSLQVSYWFDISSGFILQMAVYNNQGKILTFRTTKHFKADGSMNDRKNICDNGLKRIKERNKIENIFPDINACNEYCRSHDFGE